MPLQSTQAPPESTEPVLVASKPESMMHPAAARRPLSRLRVAGKFFYDGDVKFYGRGVTYGPFRPEADGCEYHDATTVDADFAQMAANGINCVRVYTPPPRWLLDIAERHGLRVWIGLPWEQHIAFLDDPKAVLDVEQRVRRAVRDCAGHPAIFAWAIGNEIPSPMARWFGPRRVERFLERLYRAVKEEDPDGLVTYVNYPSSEYLELPFVDFVSFNVYLESEPALHAYIARLQNIAGERPLVMGEIGLDSRRNGDEAQARTLTWQIRTLFAEGCASVFVFAWTDEWHRGGMDIDDWDFGLTTRTRAAKPALAAVRRAFDAVPFPRSDSCPLISVVICSYNGSRTLRGALEALERVEYPAFEVIVVDDGSKDATPEIARRHGVRLIQQANQGLSAARNTGWQAARGEIVAYLDDDAAPDPHWLQYLAHAFQTSDFAAIAGPNIAFPDDNFIAQCVDHSPGNPTHVLIDDREAEHLPGCNMAYRRAWLADVGGLDPLFRIAGDDVDLCWRIQQRGGKLGFHAGAMVWHHRRGSIRTYWKQQFNYGRAEGLLERKWPEKYNAAGHLAWNGRLYDKSFRRFLQAGQRIYHGSWGLALFQRVYHPAPGRLHTLLITPEWYPIAGLLAAILGSGLVVPISLEMAALLWALVFLIPALHAAWSGWQMFFTASLQRRHGRWRLAALTAFLHWLQPIARAGGRLKQGLTPWRRRGAERVAAPRERCVEIWNHGAWRGSDERLASIEAAMRARGAVVARGSDWDHWDLQARGGIFADARIKLVIEEHGGGRQLVRLKVTPQMGHGALFLAFGLLMLSARAAAEYRWGIWMVFAFAVGTVLLRIAIECGAAVAVAVEAIAATVGNGEKILPGRDHDEAG
jgi:glycosyltransferase involved in cell wall biosynthesis